MLNRMFVINCPVGLHARPASVLVAEAEKFKSKIILKFKAKEVSGKSIIGVMALGAGTGDAVEVIVDGEDQEQAMERLEKFFEAEIRNL
jgi:phosphocarrier protein HPr